MKKCYTPLRKICDGSGPEVCKTVYESSCTSKYIDKHGDGSQFVGDTKCEKLPVKVCGNGCVTQPGQEECHEKEVRDITVGNSRAFFTNVLTKGCVRFHKNVPIRLEKLAHFKLCQFSLSD